MHDGRWLGIDFGTSSTVAMVARAGGRVGPVLFGETPVLPSAVCVDAGGQLLTGRDALYLGRSRPEWLEPNPKRHIDEGVVLLGDREVAVTELVAAVLRRAAGEAARVTGGAGPVVLTFPAGWGPRRRAVLLEAAERAGLGAVTLVAEPVAAASYFVHELGNDIPAGRCVLVYDLGAGTFDASVVRRTGDGFTVLAEEGLTDAGGLDIDAAIVSYLGAVYSSRAPEAWARLSRPGGPVELRANRQLWQDVRDAKEMLSRSATTSIHLPLLETDVPLGREQLEELARPVLDRTVAATRTALRVSGIAPDELASVFLVGGSSRIPLAATLLHRALGIAPTAFEQPELAVAGGSLHAPVVAAPATFPVTGPATAPVTGPVTVVPPVPASSPVSASPAVPVSPGPVSPVAAPVSPGTGQFGADRTPPSAFPTVPPAAHYAQPPAGPVAGPPPRPAARGRRAAIAIVVAVLGAAGTVAILARGIGNSKGASVPCSNPAIAFIGPLTGSQSEQGTAAKEAVRVAVEEYGTAHPGCRVELMPVDTQSAAGSAAVNLAAGELDAHVLGVVGPIFTEDVLAAGPKLEEAQVPFITPSASRTELSGRNWQMFHRSIATNRGVAAAAVKYLGEQQHKQSIYVVTDQGAAGKDLRAGALAAAGAYLAGSFEFPTGYNFATLATTIAGSKAEAVFFSGQLADGVAFVNSVRKAGFAGPIVANGDLFDRTFASGVAATKGDIFLACTCLPAPDGNFRDKMQLSPGIGPEWYIASSYDSANFLLDAIGKGATTRRQVADYLAAKTYHGILGEYRFTSTGELSGASVAVFSVGAGSFAYKMNIPV
ncbi:Hsp70 family protein [Dactylosporangium sp. McL0621]|uniref:Hsp70 family protein n=1 Tax=Dactylosporangium sp. McL0621 TaxID=3415678 RepID=UPI003CF0A4FF